MLDIHESWHDFFNTQVQQPYFQKLLEHVQKERQLYNVYPPEDAVFNAFKLCSKHDVKVVILGQDPYHGPGQAHGLCFSVLPHIVPPPSLKNIFKELQRDLNFVIPKNGCLDKWAQQGVLLLNSILTVREASPMSHAKLGWQKFTDEVILELAKDPNPKCFVLWGRSALEKYEHATKDVKNHLVLKTSHPSPLSVHQGFLGCGHFSKINQFLKENHKQVIDWAL